MIPQIRLFFVTLKCGIIVVYIHTLAVLSIHNTSDNVNTVDQLLNCFLQCMPSRFISIYMLVHCTDHMK